MDNLTFTVASLYECNRTDVRVNLLDPMWRQTVTGCKVLMLLQDMFRFRLIFEVQGADPKLTEAERRAALYPRPGNSIDIYARPMALTTEAFEAATPIRAIFSWRYGFTLRRADFGLFSSFYSEPFTYGVWNCTLLLLALVSVLLYGLKSWERRLLGTRDCTSYARELIVVLAACCQHYLPVHSRLCSLRTMYFFFHLFAYVMYSFYTSNLLSHLVSDRHNELDLEGLAESDYECVVLENMKLATEEQTPNFAKNLGSEKFKTIQTTNLSAGVEALKSGSTALLSDFVVLYPAIKEKFDKDIICQLVEVNLYKNIQKYLFVSKNFTYKEQFKIGTLRALETGILRRIIRLEQPSPPVCNTKPQVMTQIEHIFLPLSILGCTYILAIFVLILEILHYERFRIFPFME